MSERKIMCFKSQLTAMDGGPPPPSSRTRVNININRLFCKLMYTRMMERLWRVKV